MSNNKQVKIKRHMNTMRVYVIFRERDTTGKSERVMNDDNVEDNSIENVKNELSSLPRAIHAYSTGP